MAAVTFSIDTSEIALADRLLAESMGQFEWITARAMTTAAKAAKAKIQSDILPMIEGGPTPWTRRGLIASFARPDNLTSNVGFNYGGGEFSDTGQERFKGGGVPSGRYMEINARGGDRNAKSTELALRRAGLIRDNQFITPGPAAKTDARGNVKGGEYTRILSRLRASEVGSAPSGAGSRGRSGKARAQLDYFILRKSGGQPSRWELGAEPVAIAQRVGSNAAGGTGRGSGRRGRPTTVGYRRGFAVAFNIVEQPNYERRFPIQSVAMNEYKRVFGNAWQAGLTAELNHPKRKK